ncbi:MAG: tyrosine-type recombinase/integrase, partial [Anaerolineae bacterium]|nr:tyrosine-type recombinase/integrase [Anaerolineae bacterium]
YGKQAGTKRRVHPHMCRHTAIRRMRKAGLTNDEIKAQVGHVSTEVLESYGRSSRDDAHGAFGEVDVYSSVRSAKETRPRVPRPAEVPDTRSVLERLGIDRETALRELQEDDDE